MELNYLEWSPSQKRKKRKPHLWFGTRSMGIIIVKPSTREERIYLAKGEEESHSQVPSIILVFIWERERVLYLEYAGLTLLVMSCNDIENGKGLFMHQLYYI